MGHDLSKPPRPRRITGSSVLTPPTGVPAVPGDAPPFLVEQRRGSDAAVPRVDAPPDLPVQAAMRLPTDAVEAPAGFCLCGHEPRAHEHWRPGSECGVCGPGGCPTYRERGGRARGILRKLRLVR
jgi:hypothetical protein